MLSLSTVKEGDNEFGSVCPILSTVKQGGNAFGSVCPYVWVCHRSREKGYVLCFFIVFFLLARSPLVVVVGFGKLQQKVI